MTCHRVPLTPSLCTCGAVLDITQWHDDDEQGNPLCPTCSGCGCEPNERNERVSDPTPSTDGAPDPIVVSVDRVIAYAVCNDVKLSELGEKVGPAVRHALAAAGLRVVPEDRPAPCVHCEGSGIVEENHGQGLFKALGCPDCQATGFAAPVPALDDDTRREVERYLTELRKSARNAISKSSTDYYNRLAELLAAAYLGGTDGR